MFKSIFRGISKKHITIDIVFVAFWTFFECFFVTMLSKMTGSVFESNDGFIGLICFYILYFLTWEIFEYIADVNNCMSMVDIENSLGKEYFQKLYNVEPSILKNNNAGYISGLVHKLTGYKCNVYNQLVLFLPIAIGYVLYFALQLLQYHYLYSILLLGICVLSTLIKVLGNKITRKHIDALTVAEANRNKLFTDTIININTAQKMQAKHFFIKKFNNEMDKCTKKARIWTLLDEIYFCSFKLIMYMFCPLALLLYYLLPSDGINTAELFSLIGLLSTKLLHTTKSIANTLVHYQKYRSTYEKLEKIANKNNFRKELDENYFEKAQLKDVCYTYDVGLNDDVKKVTINIDNFEVNRGDTICIHGESGQGKTTLLHLLSNEINNDNVYINGYRANSRLDCVFVSQDTEIFDMSLRENLTLGKNISDEQLIEYLKITGLKDWFEKQSEGLDTILGERGVFVSTGQRQRLNLIRGLLIADKEIYLLDEPTSNVDEETEEKMIDLINKVLKDKTVIIVTHRPKIMKICNHSYKFENGFLSKEY